MNCLACDGASLKLCLDLGEQPLANNYDSHERYPLAINYCENCWHAQLTYFVDPEKLYKNYYYVSGTSKTLKDWFNSFAGRFPKPGTMLDIASNDGSLMREFKYRQWSVFGVDPAENIVPGDLNVRVDYFNESYSDPWQYDLITAFNVLAHVPDPLSILKGIYHNLKEDGVAYVMTSQAYMFQNGQFDTIYHEHHSYFSPHSFWTLANRAGFVNISYTIEPVHGGSYLFKLTKSNHKTGWYGKRPDFEGFKAKVDKIKPYKIVGFGAAAKAVVVINALNQPLDYIVDEAPLKIGKNIPGTDIPIVSTEFLQYDSANLIIIVYAWNFYDEIVNKIKNLRPNKDDVIVRYWEQL